MAQQTPTTMKAWVFRKGGPVPDVLKLETDYPTPVPSATEVLVKTKSVSLNPVGHKTITLVSKIPMAVKMPAVPESDFSGVVVQDSEDGKWKAGQEVFGIIPADGGMKTGKGCLGEYLTVGTEQARLKPSGLSFAQAAALPLAALTAYHALVTHSNLQSGQRVFINGGSGGVGSYAVQIAKAIGAEVIATGSGDKVDFVKRCGADVVVDYRRDDVGKYLKEHYGADESTRLDLCFDTIGVHAVYTSSSAWIKKTGQYVDVGADIHDGSLWDVASLIGNQILKRKPTFLGGGPAYKMYMLPAGDPVTTGPGGGLDKLKELVEQGKVKAEIDSEYAFEDALRAYERQTTSRAQGKVVINVSA